MREVGNLNCGTGNLNRVTGAANVSQDNVMRETGAFYTMIVGTN